MSVSLSHVKEIAAAFVVLEMAPENISGSRE